MGARCCSKIPGLYPHPLLILLQKGGISHLLVSVGEGAQSVGEGAHVPCLYDPRQLSTGSL